MAKVKRPQIEPARFSGQLAGINTLLNAIREQIQIDQGDRGDPLDRAVKIRDLTDAGVAEFLLSKRGKGQYASVVAPSGNQLVTAAPPNPENLQANPTTATVYLTWDTPNYSYHAYTEVWRSSENNLSTALDLGARPGYRYYADAVDTGRKYYYWIRFVTHAGKKSDFNAVDGVVAKTLLPPEQVLISLNEKITSSQLSKELRQEIGSNANADLGNTISAFIDSDISSSLHDLKTIQQETNYFQSLYKQINQVTAKFNKSTALIKESQTVFADGLNALAETTTTLQATTSDNKTAIAQEKLRVDGLRANWSIKFQVGADGVYRVSGFGINADGETTSAHFDVDEFSVSKPGVDKLDFAIADVEQPDGSTKRMVVMDAAKLINLHVTNAMIENISADKITAGKLGAQFIDVESLVAVQAESPDYLTDESGWSISKSGYAEFNNATFRGNIDASTIHATDIDATNNITGSNIYGAYIEGGVIYGAQIIVASTQFAANADGNPATPEYYDEHNGNSDFIVQCAENIDFSLGTQFTQEYNKNYGRFYYPITCAYDRKMPVTLQRFRTTAIPANIFKLTGDLNRSARSEGDGTQFEVLYEIIDRKTGSVIKSSGWHGIYVRDNWNSTSVYMVNEFNGVNFNWKFPGGRDVGSGIDFSYRTASMYNSAGNWGSSAPSSQGFFRISTRIADGMSGSGGYYISGSFSLDNSALG